ncbi:MAG: hypothetical protein CVT63_03220 [Candidatus Anoxymicrobium japonicum]|uniref:DUF192 domain-containing protein n=1 Tax=Candidatus Anoxymicrobium japonicum TaxID=2013648 RepID=A0A2N3G6I2_9ACTN|nr:MAG: hypothetical protein CVT63_03220 [Candidatus Anoxymicrobium japonicum]
MTVRAGVHENTWGHIDYVEAVKPLAHFLRKVTPYILAVMLIGSTIFFAISCKGSTVAFSNDGNVVSLDVMIANLPATAQKGLMDRKELASNSGMLFDFGKETDTAFWMKDTSIPLSIAFIDSSGKVLAIKDMKPFDLSPVTPPGTYRYAIEVNRGWFSQNNIKPGFTTTIDI